MTGIFDLTPEQNDAMEAARDTAFRSLLEDTEDEETANLLFTELNLVAFAQHLNADNPNVELTALRMNALLAQCGSAYRLTAQSVAETS